VQEAVQLRERGWSVTAKDRQAGGAQRPTGEELGAFGRRWERRTVDVGWSTAVTPGDWRIEVVPQRGKRIDDGSALIA
jgi:hypothetical protein